MDINSIVLIVGIAACVAGGSALAVAARSLRKARRMSKQADEVVEAASGAVKSALDMAISTLGGKLARDLAGPQVAGVERVSASELVDALKAAGIPTPGCPCPDCDELRLKRAERSGK